MEANKFYRLDLGLRTNDLSGDGSLVVPMKDQYKFEITSPGKIDVLSMRSCSRETVIENDGWIRRKKASIEYVPTPLEKNKACDLEFWSYEKSTKSRHAIGYVLISDQDGLSLPALLTCEGSFDEHKGSSFCQAHEGYIQEIKFMSDVLTAPNEKCLSVISGGMKLETEEIAIVGNTFELRPTLGFCTFVFQEIDPPYRNFRLILYGYDNVLLRED